MTNKKIIKNINGAEIIIYPPQKDEYEKSNDYSIIVGVEYGKYKFLGEINRTKKGSLIIKYLKYV